VKEAHERSGKVQMSIDCNENLVVKLPRSDNMDGCKKVEAYVPLIADPQTVDDFHALQLEKSNPILINLKELSRVHVKETSDATLMMFVVFCVMNDLPSTKPYVFCWARSKIENSSQSASCSTKDDIQDLS